MVGASAIATARTPGGNSKTLYSTGERRLDPQVIGEHIDRLYRVALSLCRSREEAEDLVQETFARVLSKPRLLHSDDDVGYLLRVLKNTFVSTRRSAARRPQTTSLPDTLETFEDRSASRPDLRIESCHVYELIRGLPESFRDAVVAVDMMGLSYREAAGALGVREATLTSRLHRGRERIARGFAPASACNTVARVRPRLGAEGVSLSAVA